MRTEIDPGLRSSVASRLLQDGVLPEIERAIAALPEESALREAFVSACNELLSNLEPLALLHAEAQEVMGGDRRAARRFEILLARVAQESDFEVELPDPKKDAEDEDEFETDLPPEDGFVQLDNLLMVALAAGSLQIEPERSAVVSHGLTDLTTALTELQEIHEASLIFLRHGNPAPMHTLAWRPRKPKPRPKKPKPKRPHRPSHKIKDTHHAWISCFKGGLARAAAEAQLAIKFTIVSVTPIDACPGELVTITGTNFGTRGGSVGFKAAAGSSPDYIAEAPVFWSDTSIVVRVPPEAREGPLRIHAVDHTFESCFRKFAVYRLPDKFGPQNDAFLGGLPDIFDLKVDGKDTGAWVRPGTGVPISWVTTKGDISIDIRNDADPGGVHWTRGPLVGGIGSTIWTTDAVVSPTKFVIKLTVTNRCGSYVKELPVMVTVPATLIIDGVEITQGIQTYSTTGGPRNTIPTVADKNTIVRVYARADRGGWFFDALPNLTAALTIDGTTFAPINGAPPGSMTGGSPYHGISGNVVREPAGLSFNFRIPASFANGTKTFRVFVFGQDELGFQTKNQLVTWTWHPKLALKVRYVRVSYQGVLTSVPEAEQTIYRAFDLLPSPPTDIGPAWMPTWNTSQDLNTEDGRHTFLGHLLDQHNCTASEWLFPWEDDCPDDDDALWVAVVSANVRGRARTGENTAYTASFSFDRIGAAHELGHLLCLRHVNQGCNGDNPDPSNSCFLEGKGFDQLPFNGQVLDVPFDPYNNTTVAAPRYDMMSYACQRWISETNWVKLFNLL